MSRDSLSPGECEDLRQLVHRVNNDLSLAVGYTDLILQDPVLPPGLHESLQEVSASLACAASQLRCMHRLLD